MFFLVFCYISFRFSLLVSKSHLSTMDDNNFPRFDNNHFDFNSDPFFKSNFNERHKEFEDSFAFHQKVFFIIFGIILVFIVCVFVLVIFTICFRVCKGQSFEDYRRQRRCQTIIPPPPPLTNPCNYFPSDRWFSFAFFSWALLGLTLYIDYAMYVLCSNALGRTCFCVFCLVFSSVGFPTCMCECVLMIIRNRMTHQIRSSGQHLATRTSMYVNFCDTM